MKVIGYLVIVIIIIIALEIQYFSNKGFRLSSHSDHYHHRRHYQDRWEGEASWTLWESRFTFALIGSDVNNEVLNKVLKECPAY